VTLEIFFANFMTQHRPEGIYNVDKTRSSDSEMSSKLPNATSTKFFSQKVFIITHVDVNTNLSGK
jgi:hypothetical protein